MPVLSVCPLVSQCPAILLTKQNQNHFSKDCRLPVQLQRAMAAEAEAAREARAKVIITALMFVLFINAWIISHPGDRSGRGAKSCPSSEGSLRDHFREFLRDAAEISPSEFSQKEIKSIISQQRDRQSQNFILLAINFPKTKPHEKSLLSNSNHQNRFVEIQQLDNWLDASASDPRSRSVDVRSGCLTHFLT